MRRLQMVASGLLLTPGMAAAQVAQDGTATEGSTVPSPEAPAFEGQELIVTGRRYALNVTSSASKSPIPLIELPQSVQVITSQLIADQRPLTLSDALRNVSGFSALRNSGEVFRTFNVRGFQAVDILVDGVRQTYGLNDQPDGLATIDSIEVLKGPTAALYGRGSLGTTINIVSKQPLARPQFLGAFSTGSGGLIQPAIDLTGPLNRSGSVRARFVAEYEHRDTPIDYVDVERWQVAPMLAVDLSSSTTLNLQTDYRERHGRRFVALPAYGTVIGLDDLRVPFDLFLGEPGAGKTHNTGWSSTARLTHRLNGAWDVTLAGRYMRNTLDLPSVSPRGLQPDRRTMRRNYSRFVEVEEETAGDLFLRGEIGAGRIEHKIVVGADWSRFTYNSEFLRGAVASIDIANPVYGAPVTGIFTLDHSVDLLGSLGFYAQDQISIDEQLHVLIGLRYDRISKDRQSLIDRKVQRRDDEALSPRLGVSYEVAPGVALFGSYGKGLVAFGDGASNQTGRPFHAERGTQWEGGLKLDLAANLIATLAGYHLRRNGVLVADPSRSGFSIQAGVQRSRGLELDVSWQSASGLSLIGAYTYTDAEVVEDTTYARGTRLANVPKHAARLWGKYDLGETSVGRFAVALGATYQGPQFANILNDLRLPSSFVTDGGLFWEKGAVGAQLNIVNLFDERYITRGALGNLGVIPGDQRRIVLTLKTRFR